MRRGRTLALVCVVLLVAAGIGVWRYVGQGDPDPVAARRIPTPPAAAPSIGMYVSTEILSSDKVRVAHWIDTSEPITEVTLKATDPDDLPGTVVARNIVVVGNDRVLARRTDVGTDDQRLRLGQPATDLYVTYTLDGAVSNAGSVAGRVLARVTSLDVEYAAQAGPVVRHVEAPGIVQSFGCLPRPKNASLRACGAEVAGGGWDVVLRGDQRDDRVLASVELG